jgi:hypothetical protein
MRALFLRRSGAHDDRESSDDIVLELDRWQLTGLLLGVCVMCAAAFAVGLTVGKGGRQAALTPSPLIANDSAATASRADRQLALAGVAVGTERFDTDLARPVSDPPPANPAEAARIATHRALQETRASGLREAGAPVDAPELDPAVAAALTPSPGLAVAPSPTPSGAHALAVASIESEAAARAIADALESTRRQGHPVEVRRLVAGGSVVWRVEVGRFANLAAATQYLREFQSESGYAATLVAVP